VITQVEDSEEDRCALWSRNSTLGEFSYID